MVSGTATGQASPFRDALQSPMLLSEQRRQGRERICRYDGVLDALMVKVPAIGCFSNVRGSYPLISGPDGRHQRGRFLGVIIVSMSHVLCGGGHMKCRNDALNGITCSRN